MPPAAKKRRADSPAESDHSAPKETAVKKSATDIGADGKDSDGRPFWEVSGAASQFWHMRALPS